MINYSSALKPAMLFAAGSFASGASAATTVDLPLGSSITLVGSSPQYTFNDDSKYDPTTTTTKTKSSISGTGSNTIAQSAGVNPLYPTSADATSAGYKSQVVKSAGPFQLALEDGYYGIRFSEADQNYGGYLQVDNGGTRIHSYDFKADVAAAVPEPESWALMIVGMGGIGAMLRRSRRGSRAVAIA